MSSSFVGNIARGGDGNTVAEGVPVAQGAGVAFGGGLQVYQGTASISFSQFVNNRAIGGEGGPGVGGGLMFLSYIGSVDAEVIGSEFIGNRAIGGVGSDGLGGGLVSASLGSLFAGSDPTSTTVIGSRFIDNRAIGGIGGNGLGGGIYNDAGSELDLFFSLVTQNRAIGGTGGQGIGGGVFNDGDVEIFNTLVLLNFATDADDCSGC